MPDRSRRTQVRGAATATTEYDVIIVGAGSAGCVLANRLSADPDRTVLLIEAGASDRTANVAVPAAFKKLFKSGRDWNFATDPEPGCSDRELYVPRGKMLGGSSSMNAMIYIRGSRSDYDGWASAGCEGWSYDEVLPFFRRSENNERITDGYHGQGGELNVADQRSPNVLSHAFVAAATEWGLAANDDFNGANQDGAGLFQVTQRNGRRWSACNAFLAPVRRRANLDVLTGAHVTEIVLEGSRAVGVAYVSSGRRSVVRCRDEVVVSAGSIMSPHLLMLSGIGPADHLAAIGVTPVVDLPVGEGLQDHPVPMVVFECTEPVSLTDAAAESPRSLFEYARRRTGMLTSNIGEAGAFVRSDPALAEPDLQFHFGPAYFVEHGFRTIEGHAFTMGPVLVKPRSRGAVRLASRDPFAPPRVSGGILSDPADVRALASGVTIAREMGHSHAFDRFRGPELHPGPEVTATRELEDYVRTVTELLYHPVGTCAMGPPGQAVVDPELRVNGLSGLRIADASIMPTIVSGNTNAATIMIAERTAELMRA